MIQKKTACSIEEVKMFIDPNDFQGSDIEKINAAIQFSIGNGGVVRIPQRKADETSDRNYWLIDSAILLPADTTVILANCRIKLSNICRDNFFRSANCGIGIKEARAVCALYYRAFSAVARKSRRHTYLRTYGFCVAVCVVYSAESSGNGHEFIGIVIRTVFSKEKNVIKALRVARILE